MKKVYTVTFHMANNYGALLQTYALQKILSKKYETKVLNYDNYAISNTYRIIKKGTLNVVKILGRVVKKMPYIKQEIERINNFNKFRNNILVTKYFTQIDEFNHKSIDCIITGSDQVWNPNLTGNIDPIYFLDFDFKGKKVSYAASCGDINNLNDKAVDLIKNINSISVREDSLNKYLKSKDINDVETVLDPTLLLSKEDWKNIINSERIEKEKYIFAYSVANETEEYIKFVNDVANYTNLKIIFFDKKQNQFNKNKKSYYKAGPSEFLNLLFNAEYVITTSFHGFALSSIFNKKVFVLLSTGPDRITSLAKKISLEDRIVKENDNIKTLLEKEINWKKSNELLEKERKQSIEWLYNNIDGVK